MKTKIIVLSLLLLLSLQSFAAGMDDLEKAYKEQYVNLINEYNEIQKIINIYTTCIEAVDSVNARLEEIHEDVLLGKKYKRDTIRERMELTEKGLQFMTLGLQTFNKYKNESRSDISLDEIKADLSYNRRRAKEITDKKQELKIKLLECNGKLPDWWNE